MYHTNCTVLSMIRIWGLISPSSLWLCKVNRPSSCSPFLGTRYILAQMLGGVTGAGLNYLHHRSFIAEFERKIGCQRGYSGSESNYHGTFALVRMFSGLFEVAYVHTSSFASWFGWTTIFF